jgi:hypothetical protein
MAAAQTVRFVYNSNLDFKRVSVSGVIGGMTPHGLLLANLFFEKHQLPQEQMGTVHEDGRLEIHPVVTSVPTIERELQVGLLMTPEVALSVANWLKETADAAISARAQQPGMAKAN